MIDPTLGLALWSVLAGIIGGQGLESNGQYKGIAPGVTLYGMKIADEQGMAYESDAVAAMLIEMSAGFAGLIVTTGGTGFGRSHPQAASTASITTAAPSALMTRRTLVRLPGDPPPPAVPVPPLPAEIVQFFTEMLGQLLQ